MIYFVQSMDGGPIKIGTTSNLVRRLQNIRATLGKRVGVLGVMGGGFAEEKSLHRRFSSCCVDPSVSKEWFRPEPALLDFITAESRPWDGEVEKPDPSLILAYVGGREVAGWLEELAGHVGAPLTITVDMALKSFAREMGYKPAMPKRLAR